MRGRRRPRARRADAGKVKAFVRSWGRLRAETVARRTAADAEVKRDAEALQTV